MPRPSRRRPATVGLALCACLVATAAAPAGAVVPDGVPDRGPLLSETLARGTLVRRPAPARRPSVKVIDGRVDDWIGTPSRIGGTSRLDAGEHIYSDFLADAWGADDGDDAQRLAVLGPVADQESRTRRLDQLFQALGEQFDAPRPAGAPDHYGDVDGRDVADLTQVRWAAAGDHVDLLARTSVLTDPSALGVLLLADRDGADHPPVAVGFGTGLTTRRADLAILLTEDGARVRDLSRDRATSSDIRVAVDASDWRNALEARLPAALLTEDDTLRVAVVAGRRDGDGLVPANVAERHDEPVAGVYNEQSQALALHDGVVDGFTATIALADLRAGASERVSPGPGYHEREFRSGENISREEPEETIWQYYGLFVPSGFDPTQATPLTYWLHYRGGKGHSGGAWTPRLLTELGEERGDLVVTPHGRGTSNWYVGRAHQDFWEVYDDVEATFRIDPARRYLSGYSMGGYGTWLLGLLYPDRFAAGFAQSGALTQGMWTGEGPATCRSGQCFQDANEGDANAQLTYRILENGRHLPVAIDHGSDDELVPITGVQRQALRLRDLGYRYRLTTLLGYEHYSQAIVDEWADGAAYLDRFTRPADPRHVTYKVVPALVRALNTVRTGGATFDFRPDGAWWVDDIRVRDGDPADPNVFGLVDAVAEAVPGTEPGVLSPEAGAASPPGQSTPYVRHGQAWAAPEAQPIRNGFRATLTNVATVSLDAQGMRLDLAGPVVGTVTTDGRVTLTVPGVARPTLVAVDGVAVNGAWTAGRVRLTLDPGRHRILLRPH